MAVYLFFVLGGAFITGHWGWAAAAIPGALIVMVRLGAAVSERALLREVRREWQPRGIRCLVVYSDSPLWREHVRTHWLPRLGPVAEVLNWSERASWKSSLAVRVFNHFCGRDHNFNPAVVIFRDEARPLVFRFFYAFHEAKHGDWQFVELLEQRMFAAIEGATANAARPRALS